MGEGDAMRAVDRLRDLMRRTAKAARADMAPPKADTNLRGVNLTTQRRWAWPKPRVRMSGRRRSLGPTFSRQSWGGLDHMVPRSGVDNVDTGWRGTSRVIDHRRHRAGSIDAQWRKFYRETGIAAWRRELFDDMGLEQLQIECLKRRVSTGEVPVMLADEAALRSALYARYGLVGSAA